MKYLWILAVLALAAGANAQLTWDQMGNYDAYAGASWLDYDTPSDAQTADDFTFGGSGAITQVDFAGWSYYGESYIEAFRITFYSDVPAGPNDESHPGDMLYDQTFYTWTDLGEVAPYVYGYSITFPQGQQFEQQAGNIYWIGIQGVMVTDGYFDAWYWNFVDRYQPTKLDDASFWSDYFGYSPWAHWGFTPGYGDPTLYTGKMPQGYTSADMCFKLYAVPEPSLISLAGLLLGAGALWLRRK
jgi:hypothetical protein